MTSDQSVWWDDVRRIADELELEIHLAGMEARDRWHELKPRVEQLEHEIVHSGEHLGEAISKELAEVRGALRALREDLFSKVRGSYTHGW
ncbi:MAG: hypothetical protein ACM31C_27640 [Acidobacteriota bacterium]